MQDTHRSRSNRERSETTRLALVSAARGLFIEKGYGETSTPEIAAAAGITRGALYHHFADKRDLFRAVLAREAVAVADEIRRATPPALPPRAALLAGSTAYLAAMTVPGRTRLLLIEGPAVLGSAEVQALDEANAAATLREGLAAALPGHGAASLSILAALLSAAFDRAVLEVEAGADPATVSATLLWLVERVLGEAPRAAG